MYIVPREDIVLDGDGFLIPCERLDLRDGEACQEYINGKISLSNKTRKDNDE